VVKPACVSCGEREVSEDGYCLSCGHRQPGVRDHQAFVAGPVVAVTDKGRRHRHNEDAVAIGTGAGGVAVLVVCDGVSSTAGSAEASLRAAAAARDLLVGALGGDGRTNEGTADAVVGADAVVPTPEPASPPLPPASPVPLPVLLERAVQVAQDEASASPDLYAANPGDGGPPSSTFVAVVARPTADGAELATAWVGDSRAYWVGSDGASRLSTRDHELAGSLVRWLGADSLDPRPDIEVSAVAGPGHLVVCSDGLWRYAAEPAELRELLRRLSDDGRSGLDLASGLVDHANEQGGHDNITVALWSNHDDWPDGATTPAAPPRGGEPQ